MNLLLKKLWSNDFYRGGFLLTITSFIGNIGNYFFSILAGRSLGPQGYGEIATLFSYVAIISVPFTIITTIIIQKIGAAEMNRFTVTRSLELYFWEKIRKFAPFIILSFLATPLIPRLTNMSLISSYALPPLILLSFISSFYGAALQGLRLFEAAAFIGLATVALKLMGAILVTIGVDGLLTIIVFLLLSTIVGYIATHIMVNRAVKGKHEPLTHHTINKRLIDIVQGQQFIVTTFSIIAITLFGSIDIIFAKKFFTAYEAGIYSSWSLFAKIILYVIGPINAVAFVYFTGQSNEKQQTKALNISLAFLALIGIVSYMGYTFLSQFVVFLFFGNKFDAVIPILSSASIFGSLYTVTTIMNNYFLAKKSSYALILPILMPVYVVALTILPKQPHFFIQTNIVFGIVTTSFYLWFYFKGGKTSVRA